MALQNDSRMYSGGAVVVNTQQPINLYAQKLQQKQAREEALDNYEMNRINRMNEQGVRDIDRQGLDQRVIDMKTYYQANKDKIRKGGTPEAYNYEKMFRDTLGGVSKSKNATARAETFNKIRLERQKLGRNTPEDWFNEYTIHEDTPIWDEKFQDLDLPKYMGQNRVKYNPKDLTDQFKDFKRTPGSPRYEQDPSDKFARLEYIDEAFDKATLDAIAAKAKDYYDANDGFSDAVVADVNNPVRRGQLEQISMKYFGSAPQSMPDYAAAKALSEIQPTIIGKPKRVLNRELMMAEQQKNILNRIYTNNSIYQGREDKNELRAISEFKSYIGQAQKGNGRFTPRQEIINNLSTQGILGKEYPSDFTLSDDGTTITYKRSGKVQEPIPVEAFFNDIVNALPTKDKGTAADKAIQGAKTPPSTTMVTVVLKDGRQGQIPSDKVAQFLKDNPGSKRQ